MPGDSNANSIFPLFSRAEVLTRLTCCLDTYLVNVDLTKAFNLSDGSAYKLSVIPTSVPTSVPNLKDQALWYVQTVKYQ